MTANRTSGRPRLAHVVCSDAFAGVERYIAYVAPALAQRGWAVTVIGGHPERMRVSLDAAGIPHLPAVTTRQAARQLVRSRPFDLVHVHMTAAELAAAVASPLVRAPLVATRHFAARRGSSLAGRAAAVVIGRAVRQEISVSRFVADSIGRPSIVVPNGVARAEVPSNPRRPVVVMAQRLEKEKDVAVGIRAWAASGLADRGWTLVVAGGGSLERELQALAREIAADSVSFVGPQPDLGPLLDEASVFLATAGAEPFGLAVAEAMAQALPVVASASGAHLETVGACSTAWLFPPGDHAAGADRLRRLAADASVRADYGRALQQVQRREFDLAVHVDRLVDLYQSCGVGPPSACRPVTSDR